MIREKTIRSETKRFIAGCLAALLIVVPASIAVCGAASYPAFIANSKKHLATALTNNMGWKTVVAYQDSTRVNMTHDGRASDPFGVWKATRLRVFEERRGIFFAGLAAFLVLLTWRCARSPTGSRSRSAWG